MICALCREEKGKLIDSHFMPAAAYPHIRGRDEPGNKSPVRINFWEKSAFHTDKQVKNELLCGDCEDLFSKKGERKLGALWATKSGFPLLSILQSEGLPTECEGFCLYDGKLLDKGVSESVFYFVISIIWRAQVWDWGRDRGGYNKALGEKYEFLFRNFLLGRAPLVEGALLLVKLNTDLNTSAVMKFPTAGRFENDRYHSFELLGMKFILYVGQKLSPATNEPFMNLNTNTIFISENFKESNEFRRFARHVQSKITPKGNLSKRYEL